MSVLKELHVILKEIGVPVETGVFSDKAPDEYVVLTPLSDNFALYGDNKPQIEISEVRVSLFSNGNYIKRKNQITAALLAAGFTVTDRRYIGHEADTGYHNYAIDVAHEYFLQEGSD